MKELTLEITNKCLQGCSWCSSSSNPGGRHLPVATVKELLTRYRNECGVVRFSGGEPTLHPKLPYLCKLAKELGYYTVLLTNGNQELVPIVDEYVVNIVNEKSTTAARWLKDHKHRVTMGVVIEEGNGRNIKNALDFSIDYEIPLRLIVLQKQGRGVSCEPFDLISWTGDKGCSKDNKITVAHDGKVATCGALKYGVCSLVE